MNQTPFTIPYCFADPDMNSTNDDILFAIHIETDRYIYHTVVPFSMALEYAKEHLPKDAEYFAAVRRNIAGIGPKYQVMRRIWEEEGYDIIPLLHTWIHNTYDIGEEIEGMLTHGSRQLKDKRNPDYVAPRTAAQDENLEQLENALAGFSEMKEGLDHTDMLIERFRDALLIEVNRLTLEVWPGLLEKEPETITEMGDIIVDHIVNLAQELSDLAESEYE